MLNLSIILENGARHAPDRTALVFGDLRPPYGMVGPDPQLSQRDQTLQLGMNSRKRGLVQPRPMVVRCAPPAAASYRLG
jgi:hypothetical protein